MWVICSSEERIHLMHPPNSCERRTHSKVAFGVSYLLFWNETRWHMHPSKWDTAIVPPPDWVWHPINKLVHFSFQSLCECNEILVVSPWILSRSCSSCSVANDTFIYSVCEHTAVFCTPKCIIQITHTATHHSASSTFSTSLKNTRKLAFLKKTWRDARGGKTYNFIFPNRSLSQHLRSGEAVSACG